VHLARVGFTGQASSMTNLDHDLEATVADILEECASDGTVEAREAAVRSLLLRFALGRLEAVIGAASEAPRPARHLRLVR